MDSRSAPPLVSVIITNYNGRKYLKECFDSLLRGTYKNIEIILVDNGSSDESPDFVKNFYKDILLIDNQTNLGLSVASNRGAKLAQGEYLFFFNNDTIADIRLIESLLESYRNDPSVGISGCNTFTYDGKYLINSGVPCDIFGYPYGNGKCKPFYVDAAIFISKDLFNRLGGFDEKMFLYGEDRDICWRCWLYGYKVRVAEGAKFFHNSACITKDASFYTTNISKRFWSEFNALRSILKNYSLKALILILPAYLFINLGEVIVFLLKGRVDIARKVYFESYLENFREFYGVIKLRRKVQRERRISDMELILKMDKVSGKLRLLFDMGVPGFTGISKYS